MREQLIVRQLLRLGLGAEPLPLVRMSTALTGQVGQRVFLLHCYNESVSSSTTHSLVRCVAWCVERDEAHEKLCIDRCWLAPSTIGRRQTGRSNTVLHRMHCEPEPSNQESVRNSTFPARRRDWIEWPIYSVFTKYTVICEWYCRKPPVTLPVRKGGCGWCRALQRGRRVAVVRSKQHVQLLLGPSRVPASGSVCCCRQTS